ncbi:hypothetical protein [Acerihabitans sp.]|uniref:hypothetical protein n=1 Tax=Acerihabitans sp. TaxID=2811394 RepID=UPI002ED9837F
MKIIIHGRFAQIETSEQYFQSLKPDVDFAGGLNGVPVDRHNVAPGACILMLN